MQAPLFQDISHSLETIQLGDGQLRLQPAAFDPAEASELLQALLGGIPWRQDSLWIAGREIPVPRLQCWMGDAGSRYGYSGMRLEPEPWNDTVRQIRDRVQALSGLEFNSVLLNLYRDGQDSVSWHADDEAELGRDPVIASVSLGAVRRFQIHRKVPSRASPWQPFNHG
jgi:alkylated DNA repair dioxygenase AlkB